MPCKLQLQEYRTHHNTCNTWMVLTVHGIASIIETILTWIVGSAAVMEELSSPSVGSPRRCRLNMGGDCGAGSPGGDASDRVPICQHSKVNSTSGTLVLRWYSTDTLLVLCFWYQHANTPKSTLLLVLYWYYTGTLLLVPTSHMPTLQRQLYF